MFYDIREVVKELKSRRYITGFFNNSQILVTDFVQQNRSADFSYASQRAFFEGKATGEVNLSFYFFGSPWRICEHAYCKTNALQFACNMYNVSPENCIVTGDCKDERCMIKMPAKKLPFVSMMECRK